MAVNLDNLLAIKGAIASGEFGPEGKVVASKGDFSSEYSELIDLMSTANTVMKEMEAKMESLARGSHHAVDNIPVQGWAVSAGAYSICVMGNAGLFVNTGLANFKGVFRALGKEAGII